MEPNKLPRVSAMVAISENFRHLAENGDLPTIQAEMTRELLMPTIQALKDGVTHRSRYGAPRPSFVRMALDALKITKTDTDLQAMFFAAVGVNMDYARRAVRVSQTAEKFTDREAVLAARDAMEEWNAGHPGDEIHERGRVEVSGAEVVQESGGVE